MSNSKMPPVPPANRTDKGPVATPDGEVRTDAQDVGAKKGPPENLAEQGVRATFGRTRIIKATSRTASHVDIQEEPATERIGGPGSSHQNRQEPEKTKERGPHPVGKQSSDFSGKSGGGGEPDAHHTHDPRGKGPSHEPGH